MGIIIYLIFIVLTGIGLIGYKAWGDKTRKTTFLDDDMAVFTGVLCSIFFPITFICFACKYGFKWLYDQIYNAFMEIFKQIK